MVNFPHHLALLHQVYLVLPLFLIARTFHTLAWIVSGRQWFIQVINAFFDVVIKKDSPFKPIALTHRIPSQLAAAQVNRCFRSKGFTLANVLALMHTSFQEMLARTGVFWWPLWIVLLAGTANAYYARPLLNGICFYLFYSIQIAVGVHDLYLVFRAVPARLQDRHYRYQWKSAHRQWRSTGDVGALWRDISATSDSDRKSNAKRYLHALKVKSSKGATFTLVKSQCEKKMKNCRPEKSDWPAHVQIFQEHSLGATLGLLREMDNPLAREYMFALLDRFSIQHLESEWLVACQSDYMQIGSKDKRYEQLRESFKEEVVRVYSNTFAKICDALWGGNAGERSGEVFAELRKICAVESKIGLIELGDLYHVALRWIWPLVSSVSKEDWNEIGNAAQGAVLHWISRASSDRMGRVFKIKHTLGNGATETTHMTTAEDTEASRITGEIRKQFGLY